MNLADLRSGGRRFESSSLLTLRLVTWADIYMRAQTGNANTVRIPVTRPPPLCVARAREGMTDNGGVLN